MSNVVETIVNAFKSNVATNLGATYSELKYVFDVSQNNFKTNKKGYGVVPSSGETFSGVMTHYTMRQSFQVILTDDYVNKLGDSGQQTSLMSMYSKMDDIFVDVLNQKLGLGSTILLVESMTLEEPEFLDDNNVIVLRSNFTVQYRKALS